MASNNACSEQLRKQSSNDESLQIASWIEQAKAGDVQAFKQIYERHIALVYGLCLRLCADKSQAEDATQEVFVQLWQKLDSFDGKSKFSTWLHAVASNVCISYIRKQKGWWQKMFSIVDDQNGTSMDKSDAGNFDADDLQALIMKLPLRMRHVFVLHALEGYRHEQVAKMLNISANTSKVQFHRARGMLEEWVNE
uniref:RNA polymerase sigma factor n=1 Tax=Ningiella ruwaisensis TaxID=2364274 RepID=UPI001F503108|nr:RNA polymerase sigma factor [Ningiella ruwaisensis]